MRTRGLGRRGSSAAALGVALWWAGCTGAIDDDTSGGGTGGRPVATAGANGKGGSGVAGSGGAPSVGPVAEPPAACAKASPSAGAGKWRRLTAAEYRRTAKDLLGVDASTAGFLPDATTGPFATNSSLVPQAGDVDAYAQSAARLGEQAITNLPKLLGCDPVAMGEDACATKFIADFGARAFRRPLSADETKTLTTVYQAGKADGFAPGVQLVVETVLQSPSFVYRTEFGDARSASVAKLSGYEVASRLSYLLWGTMPDAALFAAAKSGALDQPEGVRAEAQRLMSDARFASMAADFHTQLFGVSKLSQPGLVSKANVPEFDDALRAAMQDETSRLVADVFRNGDGAWQTLLTAGHSFPSGPLLKLYGVAATAVKADGRVDFTDGSRVGVLANAGVLASHPSVPTPYGAVHRGKMVRVDLLCGTVPPPPASVKFEVPADADRMPQRKLLEQHQSNPSCVGCHELMDPIGYAFEGYDGLGRLRTKYPAGDVIDTSGEIVDTDAAGSFSGPKQLVEKLAASRDVRACVAVQWFRYALGRDPVDADVCSLGALGASLAQARGDVRAGLLAFVTSDAFRLRGVAP